MDRVMQLQQELDTLPLETQRSIYRAVWQAFEVRKELIELCGKMASQSLCDRVANELFEATGHRALCYKMMASQLLDYQAGRDGESFLWRCGYLNTFLSSRGIPGFIG